jgi:hypothetical protein
MAWTLLMVWFSVKILGCVTLCSLFFLTLEIVPVELAWELTLVLYLVRVLIGVVLVARLLLGQPLNPQESLYKDKHHTLNKWELFDKMGCNVIALVAHKMLALVVHMMIALVAHTMFALVAHMIFALIARVFGHSCMLRSYMPCVFDA